MRGLLFLSFRQGLMMSLMLYFAQASVDRAPRAVRNSCVCGPTGNSQGRRLPAPREFQGHEYFTALGGDAGLPVGLDQLIGVGPTPIMPSFQEYELFHRALNEHMLVNGPLSLMDPFSEEVFRQALVNEQLLVGQLQAYNAQLVAAGAATLTPVVLDPLLPIDQRVWEEQMALLQLMTQEVSMPHTSEAPFMNPQEVRGPLERRGPLEGRGDSDLQRRESQHSRQESQNQRLEPRDDSFVQGVTRSGRIGSNKPKSTPPASEASRRRAKRPAKPEVYVASSRRTLPQPGPAQLQRDQPTRLTVRQPPTARLVTVRPVQNMNSQTQVKRDPVVPNGVAEQLIAAEKASESEEEVKPERWDSPDAESTTPPSKASATESTTEISSTSAGPVSAVSEETFTECRSQGEQTDDPLRTVDAETMTGPESPPLGLELATQVSSPLVDAAVQTTGADPEGLHELPSQITKLVLDDTDWASPMTTDSNSQAAEEEICEDEFLDASSDTVDESLDSEPGALESETKALLPRASKRFHSSRCIQKKRRGRARDRDNDQVSECAGSQPTSRCVVS